MIHHLAYNANNKKPASQVECMNDVHMQKALKKAQALWNKHTLEQIDLHLPPRL